MNIADILSFNCINEYEVDEGVSDAGGYSLGFGIYLDKEISPNFSSSSISSEKKICSITPKFNGKISWSLISTYNIGSSTYYSNDVIKFKNGSTVVYTSTGGNNATIPPNGIVNVEAFNTYDIYVLPNSSRSGTVSRFYVSFVVKPKEDKFIILT